MTKTVFENRMVAHVWAQQNQSEGRSANRQFYFRDKTIYSYRDSWPLATFINSKEVMVNVTRVSVTTSKHLSHVMQALRGDVTIYRVDLSIIRDPEYFILHKERVKFLEDKAVKEAKQTAEQKAASARRKREQKKVDKAALPRLLVKWRQHEELSYAEENIVRRAGEKFQFLRMKDPETVETSKGAEMPVKFAKLIWGQVVKCRDTKQEWRKNGHRLPAGHFEIDSISDKGDIVAGCHNIKFAEVEHLATVLNLF